MPVYNTPGVYAEEIATLPPSVAEVSTAIPAFIGYTEKGPPIARITTMLEYEQSFGGPPPAEFTVAVDATTKAITTVTRKNATGPAFVMYYALSHYFKNGGGPCYIASIGAYPTAAAKGDYIDKGLAAVETEDEPTLIVLTDAATSLPAGDYQKVAEAALIQCHKLGDRFAILDVVGTADEFRTGIGNNYLSYGAAYTPFLKTTINYVYQEGNVTVVDKPLDTLKTGATANTALYNQVKARLTSELVVLPPSAAVAGIYASVDRERGVWKAPANVSVAAVLGPVTKITSEQQDGLNVNSDNGKSINAIRAFSGKGTLVWGARTLAGNDNEWRYISVRRLFITIEESTLKATGFAVFEPNDATTWLKVKGVIESYLYGLWERGALAGSKPDAAYFVNVGLGKTMTTQDILEGKMIVEIGIAAVRPAEFIILRFSHKLQQA